MPEGMDLDSYFEAVCREGLQKRLETNVAHLRSRGLQRRDDRRVSCAAGPGDCVHQADEVPRLLHDRVGLHQVCAGAEYSGGAGAWVGGGISLVAYCMEITDVDPLQNELLFERFLNPERISMPDIDIDFCMNRRGEVIEYVRRKYGNDQVAQIITFNTMAAKAAIKDVGRALDMPYGEVDRIAKMIQGRIGVTIAEVLKDNGPLAQAYENEPKIRELIDTAMRLEGLVRGAGCPCGGGGDCAEPADGAGAGDADEG